eukprot:318616-Pleurochrysis_carterae.AAC.1
MAFGTGADEKWFGGLIGALASNGQRVLGFDDGDLAFYEEAALGRMLQSDSFALVEDLLPGMAEN